MLIGWKHVFTIAVVAVAGALLIVWLGVIDIRASSGHWRVTEWFLHWAMRSSVRTATIGMQAPPLDDPAYLPLAAGHYEAGCAPCHGSPAVARSAAVMKMLPVPPDLAAVIPTWTNEELFQIVKHGVRYTGMPAWPAPSRDDEVWAMVAFLRTYPDTNAAEYRQRAGYEALKSDDFARVRQVCEGCHAGERLDDRSLIPVLAGQSEIYLFESLKAYVSGKRPSGVMETAISGLDDDMLAKLAAYYAAQPAGDKGGQEATDDKAQALVDKGDPVRGIAPCLSCHDRPGINPAFPKLSGQNSRYLENQLRLFVAKTRGGTDYEKLMTSAIRGLSTDEIEPLVRHLSGRPR